MTRTLGLAALLAIFLLGCGTDPNSAALTAEHFWTALQEDDLERARALTDGATAVEVRELAAAHPFERVELGEALDNEQVAQVPSHMVRQTGAGPAFDFETHLVRVGGEWRVDLRATRRNLTRELLASSFEGVREALKESGAAFVEEFEERALEASEALRETLEELEKSLAEPDAEPAPLERQPDAEPAPLKRQPDAEPAPTL